MYDRIGCHSSQKGHRIILPMIKGSDLSVGTYAARIVLM